MDGSTWLCFPETKELVIHHFQRSADFPVGVPFNIIQYAAFGLMLGQEIGYSLREVVYTFQTFIFTKASTRR